MPIEFDYRTLDSGIEEIYIWDPELENPSETTVYKLDKDKKVIQFIPKPDDYSFSFLDNFYIKGFSAVPDEFNKEGYLKGNIAYHLDKKLREIKVNTFNLDKNSKSTIRKYKDAIHLTLNYNEFKELKRKCNIIDSTAKIEKTSVVDECFACIYPKHYSYEDTTQKINAKKIINYLDENIIKYFEPEDTRKLMSFLELYLKEKYKSKNSKDSLITETKLRIDNVALNNVIDEFEANLEKGLSESDWGKFLQRHLYLIDSRYIHCIPQLNLQLGSERVVDFGLIDFQGYLDIFEIKTPKTKLLASAQDRGNYYWSTDSTKAIVQAEKYLQRIREKSTQLAADIKREKNLDLKVIKPRTILLLGHCNQLINEKQQEDFRILRDAFKDIEIITYDELLTRLKNLNAKISKK